jgi:Starch-binding associating with outer membrane
MKNKSKNYISIFLISCLFFVTSCEKRWEQMNINPNQLKDLPDGYLFNSAIRGSFLDNMGRIQGDYSGQYAHIVTTDVFNREIDKYFDIHSSGDVDEAIFRDVYNGAILNISEVLKLTSSGKYKNEARNAQASIISAYNFSKITDLFGDVPFKEAAQGKDGLFTPKYDKQEDIYAGLIDMLNTSLGILKKSTSDQIFPSQFDPLYGGKLDSWRKFGNSLKLRLAMRARFANPAKYEPIIVSCLSEPLIESNQDNVKLTNYDNTNSQLYNPWYNKIIDYNANRFTMLWSDLFIETLRSSKDPRLAFFATKNSSGNYLGMPNGLLDIPYSQWSKSNTSRFTAQFVARDQPLYILTASEVWFLRAEAALFSIGGGNEPNTLYQTGIKLAMEQWGIGPEQIDIYLKDKERVLNGTKENQFKQISTQLWIGCIPNFLESWNTVRRTGYPEIKQRTDPSFSLGVTKGIVPTRLKYPFTVEKITNGQHIQEAIDRMGGTNKIDQPVWWDAKK